MMKQINKGTFSMGSEGWGEFESPIHLVDVDTFLMDEAPVTNLEFAKFIQDTGYTTDAEKAGAAWNFKDGKYQMVAGLHWRSFDGPDRQDHPVVLVSWHDATAFADWAGKRLPTEAEWEYASRGGLDQKLYPWGDEFKGTECNWNKPAADLPATAAVKTFAANGFGLYDMVGNVWQWINDDYSEHYYASPPAKNPKGSAAGPLKVRRGASFNVIQSFRLRCANRGAYDPASFSINIGFRCAGDIKAPDPENTKRQEVQRALDLVRDAMEADGGGVTIQDIDEARNTVFLAFKGACVHCPSQSMTLRFGIEKTLKENVNWIEDIVILK